MKLGEKIYQQQQTQQQAQPNTTNDDGSINGEFEEKK